MTTLFAPVATLSGINRPLALIAFWLLMLSSLVTSAWAEMTPMPLAFPGTLAVKAQTLTNGMLSGATPNGLCIFQLGKTAPSKGTVTITDSGTGAYAYTPDDCVSGTDTFDFTVSDSAGNTSAPATVTVTINGLFPLFPTFPKPRSVQPTLQFGFNATSSPVAYINPGPDTVSTTVGVTNDGGADYSVVIYDVTNSGIDPMTLEPALTYPVGYASFPNTTDSPYSDDHFQFSYLCPSISHFIAVLYDSDNNVLDTSAADAYFVWLHMQYNMLNDDQQHIPGAFIGVGANQYLAGINVHVEPVGFLSAYTVKIEATDSQYVNLANDPTSTTGATLNPLPAPAGVQATDSGPYDWSYWPFGTQASGNERDSGLKLTTDADASFAQKIYFTVVQPHITINNQTEHDAPGLLMGVGAAQQQTVEITLEPSDLQHGGLIVQNATWAADLYDVTGTTQISPNDPWGNYVYDLSQLPNPLPSPAGMVRGMFPSMYEGGMLNLSYCPPDISWNPWNSIGNGYLLNDHAFLTVVGVGSTLEYSIGVGGGYQPVTDPLYVEPGTTVNFQAQMQPPGLTWPTGEPTWSGADGGSGVVGAGDTASVTFDDNGSVTAGGGDGNTTTATVVTVAVAGIDGATSVSVGDTVTYQALADPADGEWPDGDPTWDVDGTGAGSGPTVELSFATTGTSTVTAICGTSSQSITVTAVGIDHVEYSTNAGNSYQNPPTAGSLVVSVGSTVRFKAFADPTGATWPDGKPTWSDAASGSGETTDVTFLIPGTYTVTATCGTSSQTVWVEVIGVQSLQYSLDDGVSYTDVGDTLYVPKGATVTFQAKIDPSDASGWPANEPTWTGATAGLIAGTASETFDTTGGPYAVTVSCGTDSKTINVYVVGVKSLQFSIDGGCYFQDVPAIGDIILPVGANVTLRAITDPTNANWPDEQPVWTMNTSAKDTGPTTLVSGTVSGTYTLTATCGTSSQSIDITYFEIDFPDSIRACAGAVADSAHESNVTINMTANGVGIAGVSIDVSYDLNGIDYIGYTSPALIDQTNTIRSSLTITTDNNGDASFKAISSDIISQPDIVLKYNGDEIARFACDFASDTSLRRFPDPNDPNDPSWQTSDTGWLCDTSQLTNPGSNTPAKVYVKFMKDPSLGDIDGNWDYVNGHSVQMNIGSVKLYDDTVLTDPNDIVQYIFMVDPANGNHVATNTGVTSTDGSAQVNVYAGDLIDEISEIDFQAIDLTQITEN